MPGMANATKLLARTAQCKARFVTNVIQVTISLRTQICAVPQEGRRALCLRTRFVQIIRRDVWKTVVIQWRSHWIVLHKLCWHEGTRSMRKHSKCAHFPCCCSFLHNALAIDQLFSCLLESHFNNAFHSIPFRATRVSTVFVEIWMRTNVHRKEP